MLGVLATWGRVVAIDIAGFCEGDTLGDDVRDMLGNVMGDTLGECKG